MVSIGLVALEVVRHTDHHQEDLGVGVGDGEGQGARGGGGHGHVVMLVVGDITVHSNNTTCGEHPVCKTWNPNIN